jgi:hypothetical protein
MRIKPTTGFGSVLFEYVVALSSDMITNFLVKEYGSILLVPSTTRMKIE